MIKKVIQLNSKQIMLTSALAVTFLFGSPIINKVKAETGVMATPQNDKVRGQVLDQSGEPIIGATVKVKGASTGTLTDLDGNFSIDAARGTELEISYIGYKTQNIKVNGATVNVRLLEDSKLLEEVVVHILFQ